MRAASLKITPHAMLSRIVTGIRKRSLIINLPGSPKGAVENLQVVLPVLTHAVQLLQEDPASEASH
jgi:molybdopterin biosynthesis enzyme MoaB